MFLRVRARRLGESPPCGVRACRGGVRAGCSSPAQAATYYWSATSGDWSQAINWGGTTPGSLDTAYISNGGTAAITLPGAVCNSLYVGDPNSTNSGTIQMSAGSLSVGDNAFVGNQGPGAFIQSGGTNNISNYLYLGYNYSSSSGSYNLNGSGLLSAYQEDVGDYGTGTFTQSGGTNNVSWAIFVGVNSSSGNTYSLTGSGVISADGEFLGYNQGTAGTLSQSGGTNNVNYLYLGQYSGSSGAYNLSGSGLLSAGQEYLGYYSATTGTFTHSGGTNSVSSLYVGGPNGGSGSYNLSGSGVVFASQEYVGYNGSTGTFSQSGGTNMVTGSLTFTNGGTYNLSGGALVLPNIQGTGVFNLGGGTLVASGGFSTAQAMSLTGSGGNGTLDPGGYAVTFSGALSGTAGLNVLGGGTLTLAGSNSYTGGTTVSGSTTLALNNAYAVQQSMLTLNANSGLQLNTNSGQITTFYLGGLAGSGSGSLTDKSGGYPATLSIGGDGASTTFTGALSGSGGLTKTGSGILVLSGSNTYSGGTTIAAGTLKLDFSQGGAPTANIINNASDSSSLTMAGGTLVIQGKLATSNSQAFNGLTVNAGASAIVLSASTSNPLLLSLGIIGRSAGGTVDFTLPSGTQSASNGITTSTPNTNGILGGYATVSGGTAWAVSNGAASSITAYMPTRPEILAR